MTKENEAYLMGKLFKKMNEPELSFPHYELAYEQGHKEAGYELGLLYKNIKNDNEKSYDLVAEFAMGGRADAQCNAGYLSIGLLEFERAFKWYHLSAAQDYPSAQFNIGIMFYSGEHVLKCNSEAKIWFQKAADNGFPRALTWLDIVEKDDSSSFDSW